MRYGLDVMGANVTDVVSCAGGWLCDRAMEGWDVTVLLAAQQDVRPLQILGIKVVDLRDALAGPPRCPAAVAVSGALFQADEAVCEEVRAAVSRSRVEVTLWGGDCPRELSRLVTPVTHELSWAAGIFKSHALAAASASVESVAPVEIFNTVTHNRQLAVSSTFAI